MKNYFITLDYNKRGINLISKTLIVVAIFVCFCTGRSVMSQDFFVYPSKGQTAEETNRDKFECHEWAKQQTGIDPMRVATDVQPRQVEKRGGALRGAGRGAALGVIGGAIGGNAGKGAAIGAGVGAAGGAMRRRQSQQEQMHAYEDANQQRQSLMDTFNRAYRACLEGKDYSVN
ncbi:MAG: hypothetical protein GY777_09255 [Candidatus Brocadiaceae bacterium]|nr:hypothetical protein [Candidatus Brocadiaceae bacterium]